MIDLTNRRFGRLYVAGRSARTPRGSGVPPQWLCECDCGGVTRVRGDKLRSGHTRSCGCYRDERQRESSRVAGRTHGASHTREYQAWKTARKAGLAVSFEVFLTALYLCPPGWRLARRDWDKPHTLDNLHWMPKKGTEHAR